MSPELITMMNNIITSEMNISLMCLREMNQCHDTGLQGYTRFFRFYAMDRQRHVIMLSNMMVEYCHVTPEISLVYDDKTRTISSSIHEALQIMHKISSNQLSLLKMAAKKAIDEGKDFLMGKLEKMICDQTVELELFNREIKKIAFSNGDPTFILNNSEKLHCKYKEKEKEYFGYDDNNYK